MASKILRIPITNIYDGNDYSAEILIGSQGTKANVILDTGSSTLAVRPSLYNPDKDTHKVATTFAQWVMYGTGGWAGPVVHTTLAMGEAPHGVTLPNVPLAIADVQQRGNFVGVDGIMGLAYTSLNDAFDFKTYFAKHGISPAATYPWPFPSHSFKKFINQFGHLIQTEGVPRQNLVPFFTELESKGLTTNKFSFYTRRSWVHYRDTSHANLDKDPLNNGFFILGGGDEQKDLYTGTFSTVKVLHDQYYNTNLKSVQVEGCKPISSLPLQDNYKSYCFTNSIIDSGTSYLALAEDVYGAILESFDMLNPAFRKLAMKTPPYGITAAEFKSVPWPAIHFTFSGEKEDVTLTCKPETYWQENYPEFGKYIFQIGSAGDKANQSIFGLPLMNNYYCVFDRSKDKMGVVRFAAIK